MPFRRLTRRTLLRSSLASAALTPFAPSLLRADGTRPSVEWGAAIGDVTGDRALLWSRTDRPALTPREGAPGHQVACHLPAEQVEKLGEMAATGAP